MNTTITAARPSSPHAGSGPSPRRCRIRKPVREEGRSVFSSYDFLDPISLTEFEDDAEVRPHRHTALFLS
jgi:hypothetical protein